MNVTNFVRSSSRNRQKAHRKESIIRLSIYRFTENLSDDFIYLSRPTDLIQSLFLGDRFNMFILTREKFMRVCASYACKKGPK